MSQGVSHTFDWAWGGKPARVGYDLCGTGRTVVFLPSFSTVSTRDEMRPLTRLLAQDFRTIVPDWPGFGSGQHPRLDHGPELHLAFLRAFMDQVVAGPAAVVAAGHAAGYALLLARERPGSWSRIALVAPTWRGPLPTMMGGYRPVQGRVRSALGLPGVGHALYRLNVATPVIAAMYRRHVYADPGRVTPNFIAGKAQVARRRGGRFGSAAFVTGALDPVRDQAAFLNLAAAPAAPVLLVYGAGTPPKSLATLAGQDCSMQYCCFRPGRATKPARPALRTTAAWAAPLLAKWKPNIPISVLGVAYGVACMSIHTSPQPPLRPGQLG